MKRNQSEEAEFLQEITPFCFVITDQKRALLQLYQRDGQNLYTMPQRYVVKPLSQESIEKIIQAAIKYQQPVNIRSGGSCHVAGSIAQSGALMLLTDSFKQISYLGENRYIIDSGVTLEQLNRFALRYHQECFFQRALFPIYSIASAFSSGSFTKYIRRVEIIDGTAQRRWVDKPFLLQGKEGAFGVITRLEIALENIEKKLKTSFQCSFNQLLSLYQKVEEMQTLTLFSWQLKDDQVKGVIVFRGEEWRLTAAYKTVKSDQKFYHTAYLTSHQSYRQLDIHNFKNFYKTAIYQVSIAIAVSNESLIALVHCLKDHLSSFEYQLSGDLFSEQLYITFTSSYQDRQIEWDHFLVTLTNLLKPFKASLLSSFGVGRLLSNYLRAFMHESEVRLYQKYKTIFDPHRIFIDPISIYIGKSIEKYTTREARSNSSMALDTETTLSARDF